MTELFGFDPKTLSNDELFEKQLALAQKKIFAERLGKMDSAAQLQRLIAAIDTERHERMYQDRVGNKLLNSSPMVIETDASLPRQAMPSEERAPKPEPQSRTARRALRTSRPVQPN